MKKSLQYFPILIVAIALALNACSKGSVGAETDLSYKMLADKTWYLEYALITTGTKTSTKSYVGQTTYFINFLKNLTTTDSDGLSGTYMVQKSNNQLQIQVQVKTSGGSIISYAYNVVSLGEKYMVLENTNGSTTTKYYYSTQK